MINEILIKRAQNKDTEALSELVNELLPYVKYVIKKMFYTYEQYGVDTRELSYEDILQSGFLGLISAVNGYKGDQGASLTTYAYHYIEGEIKKQIAVELNRTGVAGANKSILSVSIDDEENQMAEKKQPNKKQPNNEDAQYIPERRTIQILKLLQEITDERHTVKQAELLQAMRDTGEATTENAGTLAKSIDEILYQINPFAYSEEMECQYRLKYRGYEEDLLLQKMEIQEQKRADKLRRTSENVGVDAVENTEIKKAPSITDLQYVHDFTYEELDAIIQAVSFAATIAPERKADLIGKLCSTSSKYYKNPFYDREKNELRFNPKGIYSRTYGEDETIGNQLSENLTVIQAAINDNSRIQFTFGEYHDKKERIPGYIYVVSPYYIVVYHDMYYLVCGREGKENASHFRIDLMADIRLSLDEKGNPVKIEPMMDFKNLPHKENWKPEQYMSEHLYMAYDQPRRIRLKIPTGRYTMIQDWFGSNYRKCKDVCPDGYEVVEVKTSPSMMVYWALQYVDYVEVLDEEVREKITGKLNVLAEKYGEVTT